MRRLGCADYHELHRYSVEDPEWFWPAVVDDLAIEFSQPWERVLDTSRGPEWATWFVGGRVNLARACVHDWARRPHRHLHADVAGRRGRGARVRAHRSGAGADLLRVRRAGDPTAAPGLGR